jgi:S-adenosylmethionine/arginine decarboxylase-like enzyme
MRTTRKRSAEKRSWGYHLILNAAGCDAQAIRSKETIRRFSEELVKRIDMVAYGKPQIVRFGTSVQKGYTLVQLIETSCISAHFSEDTNEVYLDVFSCKTFQPKDAIDVFTKYFSPVKMTKEFFTRQAPRL